jgi:ribonuclease HI
MQVNNEDQRWKRIQPRQLKLNVDASFHEDSSAGATGAVIRDYKGRFVAACSKKLPNVVSVTMAEAMAMKYGLELASRLGCNSVKAESDLTVIINTLLGTEAEWGAEAAMYADCIWLSILVLFNFLIFRGKQ